jgi:hypothetical protein
LQNVATGVRDGIVGANAAGEVLLMDALSIMVRPKNPAAVVSKNSNDAFGECASRLLDNARWLVCRYTALQCPRFSLFSCCS